MRKESSRIIKIAENSPEFRENIYRPMSDQKSYVFGAMEMEIIEANLSKNSLNMDPQLRAWQTHMASSIRRESLRKIREDLTVAYSNPRNTRHIKGLFEDISLASSIFGGNSKIVQFYQQFKDAERMAPANTRPFADFFKLEDDSLESLIRQHIARFEVTEKLFRKELPGFHQRFITRIKPRIKSSELGIDEDTLERRLAATKVVIADALRADLTADAGGQYRVADDVASISQQDFKRLGEEIYTHEIMHALSGKTLYAEKSIVDEYSDEKNKYYYTNKYGRLGLMINGKHERFRWLNEAVTETLTRELIDTAPDRPQYSQVVYKSERELLELLMIRGKYQIDLKLFTDAYFENYDPTLPREKRIPAWKTLYKTISEAYSPGFLTELDKYIKAKDVKAAAHTMQIDWHEVANFK